MTDQPVNSKPWLQRLTAVVLLLLPELRFKGGIVAFWPPYSSVTSLPQTILTQMRMLLNFWAS